MTVAVEAAEQVAEVLAWRLPRWPVNVPRLTDETASALEPHFRLTDGLAALLTVLAEETPARVELRCEGDLPGGDPTPLMRRLLVSVLAERVAGEVNVVNAPTVARECGIATEQALVAPSRGYAHLVEASVTAGDCCHTVAGALLEYGEPRIVEITGYTCDLPLTGEALLVWNAEPDKPGFVGRLGTLLGEAGVSIKAVNIAPETIGGQGLMIVSTEARAGELVREQVSGLAGLADIRGVSFGA